MGTLVDRMKAVLPPGLIGRLKCLASLWSTSHLLPVPCFCTGLSKINDGTLWILQIGPSPRNTEEQNKDFRSGIKIAKMWTP